MTDGAERKAVIYCRTAFGFADGGDPDARRQENLCRNYVRTHG